MKKYLPKLPNALLIAQILFSVLLLATQIRIMVVLVSFGLPTPTCPNGREMRIPYETRQQCWEETASIYLKGVVAPARIGFLGSQVCMLGTTIMWLANRDDLRLTFQRAMVIYVVFFALNFIIPAGHFSWAFNLIWYGVF